jgi:hypothetical protein
MAATMAGQISIPVDLADPVSIRAKLPEVSRVVEAKRVTAAEAQKDLERWVELESRLKEIAGIVEAGKVVSITASDSAEATETASVTKTGSVNVVVGILNREGREMRTAEIRALAPMTVKPDTISWALWRAAKDGLIQRLAKGRYAPRDWGPTNPDLDFPSNGGGEE